MIQNDTKANAAAGSSDGAGHRPVTKAANIVAWVLQVVVALAFLSAGGMKLAGSPPMVATFEKLGTGQWFRVVTGLLEIAGAVALLTPWASFYGAMLLVAVMAGAVVSHLTVLGGNPTPAIVLLALAGGIAYLRRNQLVGRLAR